jgi:integrase
MLRVNPSGSKSWYVQLDRNHKRKIGDAAVLTASMARFRARDLLQRAVHLKSSGNGREPTLGDFLEGRYSHWIDRKSRYGRRDTRRLINALGPLARERIDHVGLSQIERWKLTRGAQVRPATVNRELTSLKTALNRAVRWKLINENPAGGTKLKMPGKQAQTRILSPAEKGILLQTLKGRDDKLSAIVLTALNTGLSRGELFRLRWKDIHIGTNASLEVRSYRNYHNRNRKIPLNSLAVETLKRWKSTRRRRSTLVFPSPSGGQLKTIKSSWTRLMRETGIRKFCFRDCRHDFAASLVMAGVPITHVRDLLGHSSLNLTERYAAFAPGSARDAVEKLVVVHP